MDLGGAKRSRSPSAASPAILWVLSYRWESTSPPAAPAGAFRRATARRAALSAEMRRNTPDPAPQVPKFPGAPGANFPSAGQRFHTSIRFKYCPV